MGALSFRFGPFCLDTANRRLDRQGEVLSIQPKTYEILLKLIENRNRVVTRSELMKSVWPGVNVAEGALSFQINQLRSLLHDDPSEPRYIRTVPRVGFQFVEDVIESQRELGKQEGEETDQLAPPRREDVHRLSGTLNAPFGGHILHVITACGLYASLYAIGLLVEVAYDFDQNSGSIQFSVVLFFWIFATSAIGLAADWKITVKGRHGGLAVSGAVFLVAAITLFGAAYEFLPKVPITESTLQDYPAQIAYLKTVGYFVTLAAFFLLVPFHFVVTMQRELRSSADRVALGSLADDKMALAPRGTVYLRVGALAVILVVMLAFGLVGTYYLFDRLKPSPYRNLFEILMYLRVIVYFVLGLECLAWYNNALRDLKHEYLTLSGRTT